jgi:hypothetical protein
MSGPLIVGAFSVYGIFAAVVWFCRQANRIIRDNPHP